MAGFLKGLALLPGAVVAVLLAVANRAPVMFSLDPSGKGTPEFGFMVPLYALLFGAVAVGVVVGGIGTWLGQAKHRRERRSARREVGRLRAEADRLHTSVEAARMPGLPAVRSSSV